MDVTHAIPDWWAQKTGWNFWQDYEGGYWEVETQGWINEYVTRGSTYVDVGAWVGPTVLWAAKRAGRVLAIEPDPVALGCLTENTYGMPNVELVQAAVTTETGTTTIVPHTEGFGTAMTRLLGTTALPQANAWLTDEAIDVPAFTLPNLFAAYAVENVSLVKMDIEGGESEILESVCPFLAEQGIAFCVSIHPNWNLHPVQRSWFDCFSSVTGEVTSDVAMMCVP